MTDEKKLTSDGRPYRYLKAEAYMVRTDDNKNLIAEIDGGIKKEVSISCSAAKHICSVCGCEHSGCTHEKGRRYNGKICHTILDRITDAYEWSFVAVPAQVNAGVTKKYTDFNAPVGTDEDELRSDIRRLAYFTGGKELADMLSHSAKSMTAEQLGSLKSTLENRCKGGIKVQLECENDNDNIDSYTMEGTR